MLDRRTMALSARSLALRGECVFLIRETGLIAAADWNLSTRDGKPTAYKVTISETGGGRTEMALAAEVLHFKIGSDIAAPYAGTAPLKRAQLTAGLLNAVETALAEVYETAPIGTQIVPFPESPEVDMETLARGFRGNRGKVVLRESVNVTAAGGPAPAADWSPRDVTPDISKAMTKESLDAARAGVCSVFGVLPGLFNASTTGPMVREAQRHLAQWTLQPIVAMIAQEASEKLSQEVKIDVMRPMQSYDAGGRARAVSAVVGALATAKGAGLKPDEVTAAMALVDWKD
jgi:phage portal protein BeeE